MGPLGLEKSLGSGILEFLGNPGIFRVGKILGSGNPSQKSLGLENLWDQEIPESLGNPGMFREFRNL